MRTYLLLLLALVACGDSDNKTTADAAVAAVDCTTYCTTVASACTGANAQFGGMNAADATAHCMGTCAKFNTSAAQTGATLGCHAQHATFAMTMDPAVHCIHAGPAGDQIGSPGTCGDACTNFCATVMGVCGVKGTDANGQYATTAECMTACNGFDKTVKYAVNTTAFPSVNPTGDNLACRLYHATNAAVSAMTATGHCPHTAVVSAACKPPTP